MLNYKEDFVMYNLSKEYIKKHINELLCSYGELSYKNILSSPDFKPQTFSVADKMTNKGLIHFRDISFDDWLDGLITDQIKSLSDIVNINELKPIVVQNVHTFINYFDKNVSLAECIYNQEFVDIIRRLIYFSLYGNNNSELYTAKKFNDLAYRLLPIIIEMILERKYDKLTIFKLSIASGLAGLDMKGAPAASSNYANMGIPMKKYLDMDRYIAAQELLDKLMDIVGNSPTPVFYWEKLESELINAKKLVWMTDDYIESFFDLYFMMYLLKELPNLKIEVIPKNGRFGNDMSWKDMEQIIRIPIFSEIIKANREGRFIINKYGPQMGAANITKLSDYNVQSILETDVFVTKGCRIHEMLQGGVSKEVFSSYIVTRELSEIVTGFNSKETPILLLNLQPGEYAFWGINYNYSKEECLSDGRIIRICACTLKEHENRKKLSVIEEIVSEFNNLQSLVSSYEGNLLPILSEMNMLSIKIGEYISKKYMDLHKKYTYIHFNQLNEINNKTWERFNEVVDIHFQKEHDDLSVLDAATGSGRDLVFGTKFGYNMSGCDNCKGFIDEFNLSEYAKSVSYTFGNLLHLPYDDKKFDIVRQNASIVHMPMISDGYSADLALKESHRVLKENGMLYILVKKGDGLVVIDTKDGMGKRPFQYYKTDTLTKLIKRNGFRIISVEELSENRCGEEITWLLAFAVKEEE